MGNQKLVHMYIRANGQWERGGTGTEMFVAIIGTSLDGIFVAIFFEGHRTDRMKDRMLKLT